MLSSSTASISQAVAKFVLFLWFVILSDLALSLEQQQSYADAVSIQSHTSKFAASPATNEASNESRRVRVGWPQGATQEFSA
jgi:hypothetical protein